MRNLILLAVAMAAAPAIAQQHIVCDANLIQSQQFQYVAPVQHVAKAAAIKVDHHVGHQDQVIDALGVIASEAQRYRAMVDGLQSLGFQRPAAYQQPQQQAYAPPAQQYVPYAQAPYQQGTTAYGVRDVQIDAFGPQDVREIMASVSRYSVQANDGANQLMGRANSLADRIAESVSADSEAALRVATIDAETRGAATTSQALIAMAQVMGRTLAETKPQQQTRVRVSERAGNAGHVSEVPLPETAEGFPLLTQHCLKCHAPDATDPKGGFRLGSLSQLDADTAILSVYEGTMPPENPLPVDARAQVAQELRALAD